MLRTVISIVIAYLAYTIVFTFPEDLYYNTEDFIRSGGYPLQRFEVETKDGFFVSLHRIGGREDGFTVGKPAILMMTGLGCASDSWFFRGKDESLPFLLANRGYDVWLGDYRGTLYSNRSKQYHIGDMRFFNYSYHEIGQYDTTAMIDFILEETKQKSISYVGYSMGTTMFFIMMSTKPEYNKKVDKMVAMAPALYGEDIPEHSLRMTHSIQDKSTMAAMVIGHVPSGPIPGQLRHFLTNTASGKNQMWDYGREGNIARYGTAQPPEYDLSKVTVPVVIIHGKEDILVTPKHVKTISKLLPNVIEVKACDAKNIGHFDYIWGTMGFSDVLRYLPGRSI